MRMRCHKDESLLLTPLDSCVVVRGGDGKSFCVDMSTLPHRVDFLRA